MRRQRAGGLLLCGGALLALGIVVGLYLAPSVRWWPKPAPQIVYQRAELLEELRRPVPTVPYALVLGDSIIRQQVFERLCGLPVINLGVGTTTSAFWAEHADLVARLHDPALLVVAVGTNDAALGPAFSAENYAKNVIRVLGAFDSMPVSIVVPPPSIDEENLDRKTFADFDSAAVAAMQAEMSRYDFLRTTSVTAPELRGLTRDGLHPTAAGEAAWLQTIEASCPPA